jgi:hypothetical protein
VEGSQVDPALSDLIWQKSSEELPALHRRQKLEVVYLYSLVAEEENMILVRGLDAGSF